jgi:hypothetical protein
MKRLVVPLVVALTLSACATVPFLFCLALIANAAFAATSTVVLAVDGMT